MLAQTERHLAKYRQSLPLLDTRLLIVSARTKEALSRRLDDLTVTLELEHLNLLDVAFTLAKGRQQFAHRAAIVLPERGQPAHVLKKEASAQVVRGVAPKTPGEVIMMFPGQGAQFLGMGRHLYETSVRYREVFNLCDSYLSHRLDVSLRDLLLKPVSSNPQHSKALTQTAIAQPALFVVEVALARVLMDYGVRPEAVIGHSIGEFVAAHLAGVFELEAALEVVCERGRLMQSMPPGGMLAVKSDPEQLGELLGQGIDLAAHNAPGLSVVSGPVEAITRAKELATRLGLETRALHTSHAFHSQMMDPILESFRTVVDRVGPCAPQIPIISTMTGAALTAEEATSSVYWAKQLRNPVQFAQAAQTACSTESRIFVEVGPGVSLVSFIAQLTTLPQRPRKLIETLGHPKVDLPGTDALFRSLGQLWVENVELNWDKLYSGQERKFVRLPTYPYHRKRHWIAPPNAHVGASAELRIEPDHDHDAVEQTSGESLILRKVAALLGGRLGRELSEADLDKKFLELGFDSLALGQLAGRLKQQFQVLVPVRQLFDKLGTPSLLAAHLASDPAVLATIHAERAAAATTATVTATLEGLKGVELSSATIAPLIAIHERLGRLEDTLKSLQQGPHLVVSKQTFAPQGFGTGTRSAELTASQREIWVGARIGGLAANLSYNECRAFLFRGDLNVAALEGGLQHLCQRHEGLRQTFSSDGEVCLTHPYQEFELERLDLRAIDGDHATKAHFQASMRAQVEQPFDLTRGPLLRGTLIRLTDTETALVLCAHHVVVDGSSWEILIRELAELYSATVEGRSFDLPKAQLFSEYAALETSYRASEQAREDKAFWLQHLQGQTEDIDLPTDRPRPAQRTFSSARADQHLPEDLVARVRAIAAARSCTTQTFLFTAFQILLFRLTGQTDIICGVPTSGQAAVGMDALVGHCVHVLPLRYSIDPKRTIDEHIRYVHGVTLDGLEHQRATFTELLSELERPRDPSRPALIQVAFGMGRSQKRPRFVGVETAVRVAPRVSETFELYVYVTEDQRGLEVSWSYNTDLFDPSTIELWQRCLATVISEMVENQLTDAMDRCRILADEDRTRLLDISKGPAVEHAEYISVQRAISRQAKLSPQSIAIIDDLKAMSYSELEQRANQIAHFLLSRNLGKNALVAVCLHRSIDLVATLLGVWRAGLGYLPLDPDYPIERVQTILEDASAAYLLTSRMLLNRLPAEFTPVCLEDIDEEIALKSDTSPDLQDGPDDTAYVIFTSGSTGRPKGVQISHGSFRNFISSMRKEPGFSSTDTILGLTTISFDISGLELFLPLVCGGRLIVATKEQATNPKEIQRLLHQHAVTVLQATPATWQMLFESGWEGDQNLTVLCGGEGFPKHLAEKFLASVGRTWNVYGPTETTVWSTLKRVTTANDLTIGRPIDNTTCYVLDEYQTLLPQGVHGELWIGGQGVALGYLGRPELTAERFFQSPFVAGERIYRTGDVARLRSDGEFECLGRVDFQVKIRGFRIELGEVESVILKHPRVTACAVTAREDRPGEKILVGYIVTAEQSELNIEELRKFLLGTLPAYMVPSAYCILERLPMTPNNKVDRKALPAPRLAAKVSALPTRARDELEKSILSIWSEALAHPGLSPQDNFYEVGGQSLVAIRVIDQINRKFGTDLAVNELFNRPTVEKMSDLIRGMVRPMSHHLGESLDNTPPSNRPNVHRGLFLIQKGDDKTAPLFLIHGDKANTFLPAYLRPGQEIWGYHHQGSDGERIAFRTVETLAAHCYREWRAIHGPRPCILAGHSFGALVAYHVAVLRQNDGLPTPRLVIIDARHPDALLARQKTWSPRAMKRRYGALRAQREAARAVLRAITQLDQGYRVPVEMRNEYILGTYQLATLTYHPPIFYGQLEVIRSREWTERSPTDLWERSAIASIRRVVLEGSHMSLVREPEGLAQVGRQINRICAESDL